MKVKKSSVIGCCFFIMHNKNSKRKNKIESTSEMMSVVINRKLDSNCLKI